MYCGIVYPYFSVYSCRHQLIALFLSLSSSYHRATHAESSHLYTPTLFQLFHYQPFLLTVSTPRVYILFILSAPCLSPYRTTQWNSTSENGPMMLHADLSLLYNFDIVDSQNRPSCLESQHCRHSTDAGQVSDDTSPMFIVQSVQ